MLRKASISLSFGAFGIKVVITAVLCVLLIDYVEILL